MAQRSWTPAEVRALGVHTDVPTAGSVLGIGRTAAYELVRRGDFPVPPLRMGRRLVVPVAPLLRVLEISGEPPAVAGDPSSPGKDLG